MLTHGIKQSCKDAVSMKTFKWKHRAAMTL